MKVPSALALAAKRAAGEKLGGRKQTIPDSKIERAKELLDKRELTSRETAKLLRISRSYMYARLRDLDPSGWAA